MVLSQFQRQRAGLRQQRPQSLRLRQIKAGFWKYVNRKSQRFCMTEAEMSIGTIILIILVIALLGGFSGIGGGPFYGTGYYGGGGLGLIVVVLLILLLLGKL
jgi:hypothetical protein